jgi:hypothetical protein
MGFFFFFLFQDISGWGFSCPESSPKKGVYFIIYLSAAFITACPYLTAENA